MAAKMKEMEAAAKAREQAMSQEEQWEAKAAQQRMVEEGRHCIANCAS
jgi:hypothetical protein